jgi:pimeloyl-ACP methyl ester carboxylesterase
MPFIETEDETTLFYNDWGSGRPVVLIHGWPLNADMWEYQSTFLAEQGCRVVAYDRRGFGRSDQPWRGYDYDTLADDLAAVLEALELEQVTLVGFSMGGGEVARYLARHGAGLVAKAALVSAVTPMLAKRSDHEEGVEVAVFDQMVAGLREDRPGYLADFGKQFFGAGLLNMKVSSDILNWAQGLALQGSLRATLECVRAFSETDFRADMAALTMPTLIVHGDADATVPIDVAGRAAARLVPHAVLKEYEGAAHGLFYTEKDRLNADLLALVEE